MFPVAASRTVKRWRGVADRAWSIAQLVDAALAIAAALLTETPSESASQQTPCHDKIVTQNGNDDVDRDRDQYIDRQN
jgi:hypothetical protein